MIADRTLPELRTPLALAMLPHVPFDGWSRKALLAGARDIGVDADVAALAFTGPADIVVAWTATTDAAMTARLDAEGGAAMKVRQRITRAIQIRLDDAAAHKEAVRRALAVQLLPGNLRSAAGTLWASADAIWRAAGDTATDLNWYTKRAIVGSVYSATLLYWLNDDSDGHADTRVFLDRRIAGVMRFEKAKARFSGLGANLPDPVRFLGRLRYPAS